jgi:hypothetical protein
MTFARVQRGCEGLCPHTYEESLGHPSPLPRKILGRIEFLLMSMTHYTHIVFFPVCRVLCFLLPCSFLLDFIITASTEVQQWRRNTQ